MASADKTRPLGRALSLGQPSRISWRRRRAYRRAVREHDRAVRRVGLPRLD